MVEGIRLKEFPRRGFRYKRKPFHPELEDICEGSEEGALKSSSEQDSDDEEEDIVVFKEEMMESFDIDSPHEPTIMASLLGMDFW